ncbi:glutaminyl-peptide cyclotransferase [Mycobacterium sp.]|uniref:glutaminyl-peptide cyclotransferase n=1 Tax=Mycobacterium sp. TaxID=1785 RepID=UPI002D9B238B|nr:glutaminyl-peptide cyclotransferase [Mycobacterium sp.]
MRIRIASATVVAVSILASIIGAAPTAQAEPVPVVAPVVLAVMPHDTAAYTEGLELDGSALYEGTGLAGQSQLRELDPASGAVRRAVAIPDNYFGEGITVVGDSIWELTYRDGVAVEWDKATLSPVREVPFTGEGWGLCSDGDRLISSEGSARLRFLDPATLAETGSVNVTRDGQPLVGLNELECVDGQVWANVWPTDTIVRINPATGAVTAVVDASGLWRDGVRNGGQVLSGIAHINGDEFLLTGKNWPSMFRVRIDPA